MADKVSLIEYAGIRDGLNHKTRCLKLGLAAGLWYDESISHSQTYLDFIMGKFIDLTGQVFGRLTVIDRAENGSRNRIRWNCLCECGGKTIARSYSLQTGHTKSCDCLMRETNSRVATALRTTHGASVGKTTKKKKWSEVPIEYRVWASMKDRIKHCTHYKNVPICSEWINSYETFLADMGNAPSEEYQIDRIDNSKGYSPDNCRWVTRKENMRNTTVNRIIEWEGAKKCMAEWEEELCPTLGLKPHALRARLFQFGWSVEKAFTTPNSIETTQFKKK
jgi:hypothetical protein